MAGQQYVQVEAAREAARAGERLVDRQLQAHQALLVRADSLTRLIVAELGGIIAITGFALAHGLITLGAIVLIVASAITGVVAAFASLRVAVGAVRRRSIGLGPALNAMQRSMENEDTTQIVVLLNLLMSYADASSRNEAIHDKTQRSLVLASYLLGISAALFFIAILYISWRVISL